MAGVAGVVCDRQVPRGSISSRGSSCAEIVVAIEKITVFRMQIKTIAPREANYEISSPRPSA